MFTDTDNEANTTQTAIMITCSVDLSRNNDAKEGEVTLSNAMMKEDFVSMKERFYVVRESEERGVLLPPKPMLPPLERYLLL